MIDELSRTDRPYSVARIIAHASAPACPTEVFEIAVIDLIVDGNGIWIGEAQSRTFDPLGETADASVGPCTPLHLAAAIWGNWTPDLLISHDASSEAVLFDTSFTRGLPWLSMHKIARQLWPGRKSYELEDLFADIATLSSAGCNPSGAVREAGLTSQLLLAIYSDPELRSLSRGLPYELTSGISVSSRELQIFGDDDLLRVAIQISELPSPPLKYPPAPWEDMTEWAGIGSGDLIQWASGGLDPWTMEAAQIEIEKRRRAAVAWKPCSGGLLVRRREPLKRSRTALADI